MHLLMQCPVCFEKYSEERIPRSLTCGHTLCTICTENCLKSLKTCPQCQERLLVDGITNYPANYPLLRLIRAISNGDIGVCDIPVSTFFSEISSAGQSHELRSCDVHGSALSYLCCTCSTWACHDCLVVDHPSAPRGRCKVLELNDAMTKVRSDFQDYANRTLEIVRSMEFTYDLEMEIHKYCLQNCPVRAERHSRLFQRTQKHTKKVVENNSAVVTQAKEFIENLTKRVNMTESPMVITTCGEELVDFESELHHRTVKEKRRKILVSQNVLEHLKLDLKLLTKGNEAILVIIEEEEDCKWSFIRTKDSHLLLYSLNEGRPPTQTINIPFKYIRPTIPNGRTTIFFELGTREELLGRVYVRIKSQSPLAKQITIMCSGKGGVAYRGTFLHGYDKEKGVLEGGDYEKNNGTGGNAIIDVSAECYSGSQTHIQSGSLIGIPDSTIFQFYLKSLRIDDHLVLGRVTEGLDVLRAVANLYSEQGIIVKECGLLIPTNVDYSCNGDGMNEDI